MLLRAWIWVGTVSACLFVGAAAWWKANLFLNPIVFGPDVSEPAIVVKAILFAGCIVLAWRRHSSPAAVAFLCFVPIAYLAYRAVSFWLAWAWNSPDEPALSFIVDLLLAFGP